MPTLIYFRGRDGERWGGYFCVGVIEEFRVTDCAEHFSEDLATIDWIVWTVYFFDGVGTIFLTFLFDPSFCLLLTMISD
jgi:hypothetical protein